MNRKPLVRMGEKPPGYRKPGPGEESVWDYPRPPRIEPVNEVVQVEFAGIVIARSSRALRVLETASPPTVYIPPADVVEEFLIPSSRVTHCEWKGRAHYWNLAGGGRTVENAAWSYPHPTAAFSSIRGFYSFYPGRVDVCRLGKHRVRAQAGDFYGGWITPNLIGPFKGEPGTEGW